MVANFVSKSQLKYVDIITYDVDHTVTQNSSDVHLKIIVY